MGNDTATNGAEKAPTSEKEIERIGDIIKNARGTWFVLLGSLVFAAITLASVKDASFFITSEQTKLPIIDVSVPVTSFFWAGALLIAALYTYLHLYLVQLWDALGEADARIGDKPLADVIHPWLVSDAALRVRDWWRSDVRHHPAKRIWKNRWRRMRRWMHVRQRRFMKRFLWGQRIIRYETMPRSSRQRGMTLLSNVVSIALVWGFGLIIISWFWWRSMPAHDIWLTGWLGALLVWTLWIFWRGGSYALARLGGVNRGSAPKISLLILAFSIVFLTFSRTIGVFYDSSSGIVGPVPADFTGVQFVKTPFDWLGKDIARQEFRVRWCNEIAEDKCDINPLAVGAVFSSEEEARFNSAWQSRWQKILTRFEKPNFKSLPLTGANLSQTLLIGADLSRMNLEGAKLIGSQMTDVDLSQSKLRGANFTGAKMRGAVLRFAKMQGAELLDAEMQDADLRFADMQGADLRFADMRGADLRNAKVQGASLSFAKMQGTDLKFVAMQGADLRGAEMQGTSEKVMKLQKTNVSGGDFSGVSLRFVDFDGAVVTNVKNFEKSFGDGSVELAGKLDRPEGWCDTVLSDAEYWGRYHGWLAESGLWRKFDDNISKLPPIPFSEPCPK